MIYVFQKLPHAYLPLVDLSKSFNNFSTNPEVSARIQRINKLRENFYMAVDQIEKKPMNQMVTDLDWMPLFEYLQSGPELLDTGVKNANFPFNFRYTSVLSPSKDITINDGKLEH